MRIAIGLEYDGRGFCGWQSQPSGCGIQDYLEKAVAEIAGGPVAVTAAGRTDTGVHASCQVVHFDVLAERPITAWVRGVNTHLPSGIAITWRRKCLMISMRALPWRSAVIATCCSITRPGRA